MWVQLLLLCFQPTHTSIMTMALCYLILAHGCACGCCSVCCIIISCADAVRFTPHPHCDSSADTLSRSKSCSGCPDTLRSGRVHSSLRKSCSRNAERTQNMVLCLELLCRPLRGSGGLQHRNQHLQHLQHLQSSIQNVPVNIHRGMT